MNYEGKRLTGPQSRSGRYGEKMKILDLVGPGTPTPLSSSATSGP
jgi:hypothetical protein